MCKSHPLFFRSVTKSAVIQKVVGINGSLAMFLQMPMLLIYRKYGKRKKNVSYMNDFCLVAVFENEQKIVLVMDNASGGELYDHINDNQGLYDYEARKYFRQIASAVHYLHQVSTAHSISWSLPFEVLQWTPGGHCWGYYLGTLSSLSSHCSSFEDRVPVNFTYRYSVLNRVVLTWL